MDTTAPKSKGKTTPRDDAVVRPLARSVRAFDTKPDQIGRQGDLEGVASARVSDNRTERIFEVVRLVAAVRQAIVSFRRAALRISELEGETEALEAAADERRDRVDRLPEPEGPPVMSVAVDPGPAVPWMRLFLVLAFITVEYLLTKLVPQALGLNDFDELAAFAIATVLVVLPKAIGGAIRDRARSDRGRAAVQVAAIFLGLVAIAGLVVAVGMLREQVLSFFTGTDSGVIGAGTAAVAERPEIAWWPLPLMGLCVSAASLVIAVLSPVDSREQAAAVRHHLGLTLRSTMAAVQTWSRRVDGRVEHRRDKRRLVKDVKATEHDRTATRNAIDGLRKDQDAAVDQVVTGRDSIVALVATASWSDRATTAEQRTLYQRLRNETAIAAATPPWPMSWWVRKRQPWVDQPVDVVALERICEGDLDAALSAVVGNIVAEADEFLEEVTS
jgi:hypothetical protein